SRYVQDDTYRTRRYGTYASNSEAACGAGCNRTAVLAGISDPRWTGEQRQLRLGSRRYKARDIENYVRSGLTRAHTDHALGSQTGNRTICDPELCCVEVECARGG